MIINVILQGILYKDVLYMDMSDPNDHIHVIAKEVSFLAKHIQPLGWRLGNPQGVYSAVYKPKRIHHPTKRTSFTPDVVKGLQGVLIKDYTHKLKDNKGNAVYVVSIDKYLEDNNQTKVLRGVRETFPKAKAFSMRVFNTRNTTIVGNRLIKYEREDYQDDTVMLCCANMNLAEIKHEGYNELQLKKAYQKLRPEVYLLHLSDEIRTLESIPTQVNLKGVRFGYEEIPVGK